MKKAALTMVLVAVSAAVLPNDLRGQSANGSVSATAVVQANLTVSVVENLHFGTVPPGSPATVTPGGAPGAGQTLGAVQVGHNSDVQVTATLPANLVHTVTPANLLPVTFSCGYSASATGVLSGAAAACNALPDMTGPAGAAPITTFLQVGGSILGADTGAAVPGTYTANVDFVFTSVY